MPLVSMADPKNTEDQELSLDQLKNAAGGAAYIKFEGIQGEATDKSHLRSVNLDSFEHAISDPKLDLGKNSTK